VLIAGKQPKPEAVIGFHHVMPIWRMNMAQAIGSELREGDEAVGDPSRLVSG
jgi:hypothetical protein